MTALFDYCLLCGRRTRKPGEALCITHEIEALISLSYERMRERIRGNIPARENFFPKKRDGGKNATKKETSRRAAGIGASMSKQNMSKAHGEM